MIKNLKNGALKINSAPWSILKRSLDILISFGSIIITSPILIICCIAIKITSTGPCIYKQKRHGKNNVEFIIYKFRSMTVTEGDLSFVQATENDPRITKIGGFLRSSSIDELPQLLNVLLGSMSIVGPRPHPIKLNKDFEKIIPEYNQRNLCKPGITGLAQIKGYRGETDTMEKMQKRINFDIQYIEKFSFLLDVKIILLTFVVVFVKKNAY